MGLNAKNVKGTNNSVAQPVLEAANYPARVVQVVDLGLQARKPWKGQTKSPVQMLWVTYELPTELYVDEDGKEDPEKPRWISEKMNLFSLSQDNAISTKRIKGIDPKGALDGDWSKTPGMPVTLTIVNRESNGKTYANIEAVSPPMKGMTVGELKNDTIIFDLDEPDLEVYNDFPEFLQKMICENLEFNGSTLQKLIGDSPQEEAEDTSSTEEPNPY